MASFSFGAGNAGKLLRIPLYIAGNIVTLLVPRTRDLWAFGCAVGLGDGAWALWQEAQRHGENTVWLTGTAGEEAEAQRRGIRWAPKNSLRGFWLTARAAVIVVTHGFGDVNRYGATGGVIVQLWHGIPLKRIGLDAPVTTASPFPFAAPLVRGVLAALYRRTQSKIRVLPASSQMVRGRLESAFGLPSGRVPVTGEPRVDVLSQATAPQRRDHAWAQLSALTGLDNPAARTVLYAPTWRDGAPDPSAPSAAERRALLKVLDAADAVLLIRSHPLGAGDYADLLGPRVRLLGSDLVADVAPLLPAIDVLVTDYSSLVFDAALVPVPAVFLAPDLDAYAQTRGFYGTFSEVAGEDFATDWAGVIVQLRALLDDPIAYEQRSERARALSARIHAFDDGANTQRVYRAVQAARAANERES